MSVTLKMSVTLMMYESVFFAGYFLGLEKILEGNFLAGNFLLGIFLAGTFFEGTFFWREILGGKIFGGKISAGKFFTTKFGLQNISVANPFRLEYTINGRWTLPHFSR